MEKVKSKTASRIKFTSGLNTFANVLLWIDAFLAFLSNLFGLWLPWNLTCWSVVLLFAPIAFLTGVSAVWTSVFFKKRGDVEYPSAAERFKYFLRAIVTFAVSAAVIYVTVEYIATWLYFYDLVTGVFSL